MEEVFCTICRGILIEPVKLPCNHAFCFLCFNGGMGETSYHCPVCRLRVSNWIRKTRKAGSMVNKPLWNRIQKEYPAEVLAKLEGRDDGIDAKLRGDMLPVISKPGEVASEYFQLLRQEEEERRRELAKEEQASLELIEKLKKEEEERKKNEELLQKAREEEERMSLELIHRLQEEEEENEKKSLELIKLLQEEDKKTRKSTSTPRRPRRSQRISQIRNSIRSKVSVGPIDQYTTKNTNMKNLDYNSDSRDSIESEISSHFKPIRCVPKTPPKANFSGVYNPRKQFSRTPPHYPEPLAPYSLVHSPRSAFLSKGEDNVLKEINVDENNDSNSFVEEGSGKCGMSLGSENQSLSEMTFQ